MLFFTGSLVKAWVCSSWIHLRCSLCLSFCSKNIGSGTSATLRALWSISWPWHALWMAVCKLPWSSELHSDHPWKQGLQQVVSQGCCGTRTGCLRHRMLQWAEAFKVSYRIWIEMMGILIGFQNSKVSLRHHLKASLAIITQGFRSGYFHLCIPLVITSFYFPCLHSGRDYLAIKLPGM